MTQRKTKFTPCCSFFVLTASLACVTGSALFLFRSWPRPLPKRELVFQVWPFPTDVERGDFGFVDTDKPKRADVSPADYHCFLPAWSPGGSLIAYRWTYGAPYDSYADGQVIISRGSGLTYLTEKDCTRKTWGRGRIRWTSDGAYVITVLFSREGGGEGDQVVPIDPSNCDIGQVLLQAATGERLFDPDLSTGGELAYSAKSGDERERVTVMNLQTGERRTIGEGINPAWCPDAHWLAYTGYDGLYIVHPDGTGQRRVLDYPTRSEESWRGWPPRPEWSPDGKWLVYHRVSEKTASGPRYSIFKLNLATGEEVKILDDGINPHWRWNKSVSTGG